MRWDGVLGLIIRQARFAAAADVKVYPNLLDIRKYELLVRKGQLQEMGLRHTRVLGSGTEFERLREYQLDDEFRRIDWKAMARRGKPITREFETERSQNVVCVLDIGRLMRSPVQDASGQSLAKVDYAVNAVLMLSYVAGLRGDKVGLLAFADQVTHYLAPKLGKGQFYRMLALLYAIESQPVESDYTKAFTYLVQLGDKAARSYALEESARVLHDAVRSADRLPQEERDRRRLDVIYRLAHVLALVGRPASAPSPSKCSTSARSLWSRCASVAC